MNEYVAAVALPEMMQDSTGECTVSGWGTLHSGRQHQSFTRPNIVLVRDVNEISRIFHNFVDSLLTRRILLPDEADEGGCAGGDGRDVQDRVPLHDRGQHAVCRGARYSVQS